MMATSRRVSHRRGLTRVDVLCTVVISALIALVLVPTVGRPKETANYNRCQANLSVIGKAMVMYSALASDKFPVWRIAAKGNPNVPVNSATQAEDVWSPNLGTNGMQNVWALINMNIISEGHFHCPDDKGWTKRGGTMKFGWTAPTEFSYGLHFAYDADASDKPNAARWSDPGGIPGLVVVADRNPYVRAGEKPLPSNHADGQNILHRDSTVTWSRLDGQNFDCGYKGDNIYTAADGSLSGPPTSVSDTLITPVPSR